MTEQSFKSSRSSMIFLHSSSNTVTKLWICYTWRHSLLMLRGNILEDPLYERYVCALDEQPLSYIGPRFVQWPHSMSSDWPKIWHKSYYDFNLWPHRHFFDFPIFKTYTGRGWGFNHNSKLFFSHNTPLSSTELLNAHFHQSLKIYSVYWINIVQIIMGW